MEVEVKSRTLLWKLSQFIVAWVFLPLTLFATILASLICILTDDPDTLKENWTELFNTLKWKTL